MKKLKEILVEVGSKKFLAVIFSMLFVANIAGPVFAANNKTSNTNGTDAVLRVVDNKGALTNISDINIKGDLSVVGIKGKDTVILKAKMNGSEVLVEFKNKSIYNAYKANVVGHPGNSMTVNFKNDKAKVKGANNGNFVISGEKIKSATVIKKKAKISKKKSNKDKKKAKTSKKKSNKGKKKANKANKAVKKTTNKTWTDKKGNVHSSKITTTRIKNKKGKVVKTIVNATTTVKDSNGKTVSTTERESTFTRNKKGGFTSTIDSTTKDAEGNVTKTVDQTLNVDKKGNVTGTKTVTDKDGNKVTYDVTGTRKVNTDKDGNKTVTYNLKLKDQKTGKTINIKTESVYDKDLNRTSYKKLENGNLTRVETNGVLQFTRDSKGNANFYKNGVFDHAVSANEFKGLTKAQRNEVIKTEIAHPETANKNIQEFKNQNQQKRQIWNSFAKKKIDNYTYDTVKKGPHKGQVKLTVQGANGYKFVVYVKNDKDAIKLGDKIWAAKNTSALQGLLKNHKVSFYKSGKEVAKSKKHNRGMDLLF